MNRLSFSRQPTVWIGLVTAAVAFAAVFGLHMPQGFEAALAAFATAAGAAVTWTQVSPAKRSVRIDAAPEVHVTTVDGDIEMQRTYYDGKFAVGSTVIAHDFPYADPPEVAAKSAADLKAEHDRVRAALGITPEYQTGGVIRREDAPTATEHGIVPAETTGGYPSSSKQASQLKPPRTGPAPGAKKAAKPVKKATKKKGGR